MRVGRFFLIVALGAAFFSPSQAQQSATVAQTTQRDAQALVLIQKSVTAFGTSVPLDSTATGTVTVVEGSTTQTGTIQILTRGTAQTVETIILPDGQRSIVYFNGNAKEVNVKGATNPPLELILTDQCVDFPLPLLLSVLNTPDEAYRYVGEETLDGTSAQHIQVWNTFASKPRLGKLSSFSTRDIWFDTSSGLPLKITYSRRAGGGSVPAFPVEVTFSNYTNVNGVSYPFQINKSFNGTPWQTITIQNVSFNTGLTDAQFQVE
jgi:hypothetical protein